MAKRENTKHSFCFCFVEYLPIFFAQFSSYRNGGESTKIDSTHLMPWSGRDDALKIYRQKHFEILGVEPNHFKMRDLEINKVFSYCYIVVRLFGYRVVTSSSF